MGLLPCRIKINNQNINNVIRGVLFSVFQYLFCFYAVFLVEEQGVILVGLGYHNRIPQTDIK